MKWNWLWSFLIGVAVSCGLSSMHGSTAFAMRAPSDDLHISLPGTDPISYKVARFSCDDNASKLGLPSGRFQVEYINGRGNSLAVLPIGGKKLIFAGVLSGSGARYASDRYIWSDGGIRGAFLSSDSLAGQAQTLCTSVTANNGKP